jgi:DNA-binding NarL/FixJ family response regulator
MRGSEAIRCILISGSIEEHNVFVLALKESALPVICHYYLHPDEALHNLYHRSAPEPKLIFLDINIQQLNGLEFLRKIKAMKSLAHIPVYAYSVGGCPEYVVEAMDLGAAAYLIKPATQKELVTLLTNIITDFLPDKVRQKGNDRKETIR